MTGDDDEQQLPVDGVPFMDLKSWHCRFIVGYGDYGLAIYCGKRRSSPSSWCPEHRKKLTSWKP